MNIFSYLNDCNNENILREAIVKYEYDFTKIRSIHSNDKEFLLQDKFQGNYTPVILIFICMGLSTFIFFFYAILKEIKKHYAQKKFP
jgi:hypothetical protein